MNRSYKLLPLAALAAALVAGCGRDDDRTVGQRVDSTIAQAERKAEQAEQRVESGAAEAERRIESGAASVERRAENAVADAKEAAADAGRATERGLNRAGEAISDATITAAVKTALAADPQLKALRIDVDTRDGVVTLNGPAPTREAKERATTLAAAPKGVVRVENQLRVEAS